MQETLRKTTIPLSKSPSASDCHRLTASVCMEFWIGWSFDSCRCCPFLSRPRGLGLYLEWSVLLRTLCHRQLNEACLRGRVIYTLHRLAIVFGLRPENVGHKCLRTAIVERKPTGLHLHHDAMHG